MLQRHARRVVGTAIVLALFGLTSGFVTPPTAEAIPAWARKYGIECTSCHTAWPSLNAYGRDFKINGYKIPDELELLDEYSDLISDFLQLDKQVPVAVLLKLRPYDKKKDKRARIRAGHESEILIGGSIDKTFSAFVEFEAEDEVDFNLGAAAIVASWNPSVVGNISMGYSNVFFSDPYDTLAEGGRRMTRNHKGPLNATGLAGQRLRGNTQWVGGYGKAADRFFYMAGVSAGNGEPEGDDAADFFARAMVDVTPEIMVGGYILDGTNDTGGDGQWDFKRYGFDAQVEVGDFKAYGMYMRLEDDAVDGSASLTQNLGYIEGMYVFHPSGMPLIVPVVRLDFLDGTTDLTANLQFYIKQNIKAYAEYLANIHVPSGQNKNNRFVVQIEMAF